MIKLDSSGHLQTIISDEPACKLESMTYVDIRSSLINTYGKKIALHCHPANMVRLALSLNGFAKSMLLVPFDACETFIKRAETTLDLDHVLIDESIKTIFWSKPPININQESGYYAELEQHHSTLLDTRWLLATSGTTGTPKIVSHTTESLTRTVANNKDIHKETWGLLYDPSRFAGIQVVLQAAASSSKLIIPSPTKKFEEKIDFLAKNDCTALSATPTLWRKILMTKTSSDLKLSRVTLGGEIADQSIINSLAKAYPNALITHIFASTEAGVGFSVKDKKSGFPLDWLKNGIRGVQLKSSSAGTLCLKNTMQDQAYLGTAEKIADDQGWIDTGDIISITEDRVYFKGRLNGAINIGGNKVTPEEIEAEILKIQEVFQVSVRAKKSSITGSLIEALVVPHDWVENTSALPKIVKQHCITKLPNFKVPAFVRVVDELPVGATGKIKR